MMFGGATAAAADDGVLEAQRWEAEHVWQSLSVQLAAAQADCKDAERSKELLLKKVRELRLELFASKEDRSRAEQLYKENEALREANRNLFENIKSLQEDHAWKTAKMEKEVEGLKQENMNLKSGLQRAQTGWIEATGRAQALGVLLAEKRQKK